MKRASSKAKRQAVGRSLQPIVRPLILFSERRKIAELADRWFDENPRAERCTLNVVTAIYHLGLLVKPNPIFRLEAPCDS